MKRLSRQATPLLRSGASYHTITAKEAIPNGFFALSSAFGEDGPQGMALLYQPALWLAFASPVLSLAMVLLLWFSAGWLSKEVAGGTPEETADWSPRSLLSVGVVLLGLALASFALWHFGGVIGAAVGVIAAGKREEARLLSYLIANLVQLSVGIGLILGSGRIGAIVARLRRW